MTSSIATGTITMLTFAVITVAIFSLSTTIAVLFTCKSRILIIGQNKNFSNQNKSAGSIAAWRQNYRSLLFHVHHNGHDPFRICSNGSCNGNLLQCRRYLFQRHLHDLHDLHDHHDRHDPHDLKNIFSLSYCNVELLCDCGVRIFVNLTKKNLVKTQTVL